jgi:hypothetical protein
VLVHRLLVFAREHDDRGFLLALVGDRELVEDLDDACAPSEDECVVAFEDAALALPQMRDGVAQRGVLERVERG